MANTKISQLPSFTGTAADLRWFVTNNSGETETFKYSGFSTSITFGEGSNSIKSTNATSASGTNAVSIGAGAAASGTGGISIGTGSVSGAATIGIGNNLNGVSNGAIAIGSAMYSNGQFNIQIGNDTAANTRGIVIGQESRSGANDSITIGNSNDQNLGVSSSIIGYNNLIAIKYFGADYYDLGGSYNNIYAADSFIGFRTTGRLYNTILGGYNQTIIASGNSNTIIGGFSNTISGTTSGSTLLGMNNFIPTRNDATFAVNYVMTNYAALDFVDDTAAAAGGVVLGQMYHNAGAMRIRVV